MPTAFTVNAPVEGDGDYVASIDRPVRLYNAPQLEDVPEAGGGEADVVRQNPRVVRSNP